MSYSLVQMPTTPENWKKLEEVKKIMMEMSQELYGSESKKYCQDIISYSWQLYLNGKEYHIHMQKIDGILKKKEIQLDEEEKIHLSKLGKYMEGNHNDKE